jgi:hypothetical protein
VIFTTFCNNIINLFFFCYFIRGGFNAPFRDKKSPRLSLNPFAAITNQLKGEDSRRTSFAGTDLFHRSILLRAYRGLFMLCRALRDGYEAFSLCGYRAAYAARWLHIAGRGVKRRVNRSCVVAKQEQVGSNTKKFSKNLGWQNALDSSLLDLRIRSFSLGFPV